MKYAALINFYTEMLKMQLINGMDMIMMVIDFGWNSLGVVLVAVEDPPEMEVAKGGEEVDEQAAADHRHGDLSIA